MWRARAQRLGEYFMGRARAQRLGEIFHVEGQGTEAGGILHVEGVGRGYGSGIAKSPMSQNDSYSTQSKYNIIKTTSDHQ